jgi:hypothetical protein
VTHPRLVHVPARDTEMAGDHDLALALIATSLDQRNGSSDRAWTGLSCVAVVDVSSCHRWLGGFAR